MSEELRMKLDSNRPQQERDNRREDRQARRVHFDGELALRRSDASTDTPVAALRNVSTSGASVLLQHEMPAGCAVSVVLYTGGVRMEFLSNVAWCRIAGEDDVLDSNRPHGGPMYAVGLQILAPGSFSSMITAHQSHARPSAA
jgi:hypothetical protein